MNKTATAIQGAAGRDNASIQGQINELRSRLLDKALVFVAILIVPAIFASLLRAYSTGWQPVMYLHILLGILFPVAAFFRRHLAIRIRAIVLFGSIFLTGAAGLFTYGLIGGGIPILVITCLAVTIIFGLRIGVIILIANILLIILTGIAVYTGFITYAFDFNVYGSAVSSWVNLVVGFTLMVGLCVVILGLFNQYLFNAVSVANRRSDELQQSNKRLVEEIKANKIAEEKIKKSEEKLSKAFDASPDGVSITRLGDGKIIYTNPGLAKLLKYPAEMVLGKSTLELDIWVDPEDREELIKRLGEKGKVSNFEMELRTIDGEIKPMSMSASLMEIEGEKYLVSLARDITEQKRIELDLEKRSTQLLLNQKVLLKLAKENYPDQETAINRIIKTDAEHLNLERVSVWLFNREHTEITCKALYQRGEFSNKEIILKADDYPRYFQALEKNGFISAYDACNDPATSEFATVYLAPLGISSLMDVPIHLHGEIVGIVCHEHIGPGKKWTVEEEDFANSIAEMCALVLAATEHRKAQEKLQQYQMQLRALASEITIAEEQERRRIAIELHDHIIQDLGLSKIKLGELAQRLSTNDCQPLAEEVRRLIEQIIRESRSLVFDLSLPILYDLGFEEAIKWLAEQTATKLNISCEVRDDGLPKPMSKEMQVLLYKAVRELMINIGKHAQADKVNVYINRVDGQIDISVQDDGKGFNSAQTGIYSGETLKFGLFGIRERLNLLSGSVKISSAPGSGTLVTLTAPLDMDT